MEGCVHSPPIQTPPTLASILILFRIYNILLYIRLESMRSKKITIVDIAEDDETVINNDVETVKEPLIDPLQSTEIVCVSSTDIKKEPLIEPPVANELKK